MSSDKDKLLSHSIKRGSDENTGLFVSVKCPNCHRTVSLIIMVYLLPMHKKKIKGLIENFLSHQEYKRFKELETVEKIVFALGKFFDNYGRWPESEREFSRFIGLTQQTISKYVNSTEWITSETQERGLDGRFERKKFYLTEKGKSKYSELVYRILSYA